MSYLMQLQRFLAIHRKQVASLFFIVEILMIVFWLGIYIEAFNNYDKILLFVYESGLKLGQAAVILYIVTLIPGIITRLQWQPKLTQPIASIILPFRRHFGILMFLTAFVHLSFTTTLPYFEQYDFKPPLALPPLALFQWMGLIAWLCLLPLWLTSNDLSQKRLGKNWKVLHRLTYFALIFIFLHTALQRTLWMYVIGTALVLEVISWITYWRREASKPILPPQPTVIAQVNQVPPQPLNNQNNDSIIGKN